MLLFQGVKMASSYVINAVELHHHEQTFLTWKMPDHEKLSSIKTCTQSIAVTVVVWGASRIIIYVQSARAIHWWMNITFKSYGY